MTAVLRRAAGAPFALVVAVLLLGTGVAGAATGGTFLLGRANTATTTTVLSTTRGVPLDLRGPSTTRPLSGRGACRWTSAARRPRVRSASAARWSSRD